MNQRAFAPTSFGVVVLATAAASSSSFFVICSVARVHLLPSLYKKLAGLWKQPAHHTQKNQNQNQNQKKKKKKKKQGGGGGESEE
jgi:hypothetical protein